MQTLIYLVIIAAISKVLPAYDILEKLIFPKTELSDECYAYADPNQLQLLYQIEENDRQLWGRHFQACSDKGPVMYNSTAKDDYCKIHLRPVLIQNENLDKVNAGLKLDISFRSAHNSQWCIKVYTWMAPSYIKNTHALQIRRRRRTKRSDSNIPGITLAKQIFHGKWAQHNVNHCPPVNNLNDGLMLCVPLNDTLAVGLSERDAIEMTEEEINVFKDEIFKLIDHERIISHYRLNCDLFSFFYGHRSYLSCVRNHLYLKGLHLPIWNPTSGYVPTKLQAVKRSPYACLSANQCHDGWLDISFPPNTRFDVDLPVNLKPENICSNSYEQLYNATFVFHHQIHILIGGIFFSFDSSASLLFYLFHNWMDKEILRRWELCSAHNMNMRSELIKLMNL